MLINVSVEMTITWHFDSIDIGFFETITDCQDVRHLGCCYILTFPPVGSNKLGLYINFVFLFSTTHESTIHWSEQIHNLSLATLYSKAFLQEPSAEQGNLVLHK